LKILEEAVIVENSIIVAALALFSGKPHMFDLKTKSYGPYVD
jgi:hypothetical protein